MLSPLQEWVKVRRVPYIIDDDQYRTVDQQHCKMRGGCINTGKPWTLFAQGVDQVFDLSNQVARVLAERDPYPVRADGLLAAAYLQARAKT